MCGAPSTTLTEYPCDTSSSGVGVCGVFCLHGRYLVLFQVRCWCSSPCCAMIVADALLTYKCVSPTKMRKCVALQQPAVK